MRLLFLIIIYSALLCGSLMCSAASIATNANNTVTLTEYYDYECPHCRRMAAEIGRLQTQYPNLHIIYRVTPLINSRSRGIASFALATKHQYKWQATHQMLMRLSNAPNWFDVNTIIEKLKMNKSLLIKTMWQRKVQRQINHNIKQAGNYITHGGIYLPMLVFTSSRDKGQVITLLGEQPYALLSAVVQQLGEKPHVQVVNKKK